MRHKWSVEGVHGEGDDKVKTILVMLFDPLHRFTHHENLAIEARIHIGTIAMFGVEQHILVLFNHIDNMQFDTELLGDPQRVITFLFIFIVIANSMSMAFHTEAGKEVAITITPGDSGVLQVFADGEKIFDKETSALDESSVNHIYGFGDGEAAGQ